MTRNTTGVKRRLTSRWVFGASFAVHVVALAMLWRFDFLGTNTIALDREAEAQRSAQVEKRERARQEQERAAREDRVLPEPHAEKLKKEARRRASRHLAEKVERIRETYEQIREVRARKLEQIEKRPEPVLRRKLARRVLEQVEEAQVFIQRFTKDATDKPTKDLVQRTWELRTGAKELVKAPGDPDRARWVAKAAQDLTDQLQSRLDHDVAPRQGWNTQRARERLAQVADTARKLAEDTLDLDAFNDVAAAGEAKPIDPEQAAALDQMTPQELYERAMEMERKAAQAYADARAAELAMVQSTTFAQAQEKLNASPPRRPPLGEALAGERVRTVGDLNRYRDDLARAVQEAESMRLSASNQLGQVRGIDPGKSAQTAAAVASRYAQMIALQGAATLTGHTRRMDLSMAMRMGYGGSSGANSIAYANSNLGAGGEFFTAATARLPDFSITQDQVSAQALPGRKFSKDSDRQGWLYIDTWYVIGPWENHGKIDYSVIHPPEYEINFDAVYQGKEGEKGEPKALRWQFTQSDMIRVTPPDEESNATYYAYTELYFEEDADMLLAIASDDASKVWINDMVVWEDLGLSPWKIGEGFRKVFFHKGYNTLLVRIENGPNVCQFSVLICPTEIMHSQ